MTDENNKVCLAIYRLNLADVWDLAPHAGPPPTKDGAGIKSPFREERTGSFSVGKNLKRFVDFGQPELKGGVWQFVQFCFPDLDRKGVAKILVERAGLEWDEVVSRKAPTPKELAAWRAKRRQEAAAAREKAYRDRKIETAVTPVPEKQVEPWPSFVQDRFSEGVEFFKKNPKTLERLAKWRGWPIEWLQAAIKKKLVAYPWEPNFDGGEKYARRGVAFPVIWPQLKNGNCSLVETGYHQRTYFPPWNGKPERRGWVFVPNSRGGRSDFAKKIEAVARNRGIGKGETMVAPAPFLLGDLASMKLLVVTEGQWDAIALWGAIGGFSEDFSFPIAVCGVRGVSGDAVFLSAIGPWIRRQKPIVWVLADNDRAGKRWYRPTGEPGKLPPVSLVEKLRSLAPKVKVSILRDEAGGKDFDDYYRERKPSKDAVLNWMHKLEVLPT